MTGGAERATWAELAGELATLVADVKALAAVQQAGGVQACDDRLALPEVELEDDDRSSSAAEAQTAARERATSTASAQWATVATAARPATDRRGVAGARETVDAVRTDLGDCTRCGLCEGRTTLVFGEGDPQADLMVIGEAPDAYDEAAGAPFKGEAGVMLDAMLSKVVGVPREQAYLTGVVKCRVPDGARLSAASVEACASFLHRQIDAVQPKVLLLMGGAALHAVLGLKGITEHRGKPLSVRGVLAIPTFHPRYLLRKPSEKRAALHDLQLVKRHLGAG